MVDLLQLHISHDGEGGEAANEEQDGSKKEEKGWRCEREGNGMELFEWLKEKKKIKFAAANLPFFLRVEYTTIYDKLPMANYRVT
jgi:hypothetical protein